jgi:hypothetical protein
MRAALLGLVFAVAFAAGVHVRDVEASGGSSKVNLSAYSGSVGISGAVAITGTLAVTGTGTITANRATLTSTSGTALTATGQGNTHGMSVTGGGGASVAAISATATNAANGSGLIATADGTGLGVWAISEEGGRAIFADGDATTPTRSPLGIEPQDNNPSACVVGDLFVCNGNANCGSAVVLKLCTATNTWTTVGP